MDKIFKKMEADVRMNQETVMDIKSDQDRLNGILGKAAEEYEHLNEKYEDEMSNVCQFQAKIKEMTATGCNLVLTTGGTGCAPRDVTPEATASVLHKLVPGIAHAMTASALTHEPHAMLSRGVAGIRDRCLVVNLPGRPKAAAENAAALAPVLVHALRQVNGD